MIHRMQFPLTTGGMVAPPQPRLAPRAPDMQQLNQDKPRWTWVDDLSQSILPCWIFHSFDKNEQTEIVTTLVASLATNHGVQPKQTEIWQRLKSLTPREVDVSCYVLGGQTSQKPLKVTEATKAPSSNFAAQRKNNVDILENLSEWDADVGVDAVKSDVAAGPGQPAGSPDRDYPRFSRFDWWLFNHLCLFLRTSPSRDEWKKENWDYAQLNKEIHIRSEDKNACILNFPLSGKDGDCLRRNGHNGHNG
jgi:hypothetical protein